MTRIESRLVRRDRAPAPCGRHRVAAMTARSVEGAVTAPDVVNSARRGGVRLALRTAGREHAGARLRELPGADHHWWLPEPSEVADLITVLTEEHSR